MAQNNNISTLEQALVNADAAGDKDAATTLASEITRLRSQPQQDEFGSAVDAAYGSQDVGKPTSDNMLSSDGSQQAAPSQSVLPKDAYANASGYIPQATNQSKGFLNNFRWPWQTTRQPDNNMQADAATGLAGSVSKLISQAPTDKARMDQAASINPDLKTTPFMKDLSDRMNTLYENGQADTDEYKTLDTQYQKEKMWNEQFNPKTPITVENAPQRFLDGARDIVNVPSQLRASFRDDPGGTLARFASGFLNDPEFLVAPEAWEGGAGVGTAIAVRVSESIPKVAKYSETIGKAGSVAGGLTSTGTVGAGMGAATSVAQQESQNGSVDWKQVGEDAAQMGTTMALFSGLVKGTGTLLRMSKGANTVTDDGLSNAVQEAIKNGTPFDQTVNNILDQFGLNGTDKADAQTHIQSAIVDEMNDFYTDFGPSPRSGAEMYNVYPTGRSGGEMLDEAQAAAFDGAEKPSVLGQGTSGAEGGDVSPVGFQKGRILKPSEAEKWAKRQTGEADPRLLAALGLAGVGAAGAYMLGTKPEDIAKYALVAGGIALGGRALFKFAKGATDIAKFIAQKDTGYRIDNLLEPWDRNVSGGQLANLRLNTALKKIVPDQDRGIAIRKYLQGDKSVTLSPVERKAADIIRQRFDDVGKQALDNNVIKDMIPDYVTGLYKGSGKTTSELVKDFMDSAGKVGYNMSSKTPFALEKVFKTYEQAKEIKGLQAAYEHPADILRVYSDAMSRAIENKKLLDSLKTSTFPDGTTPLMSWKKAPRDWPTIVHPQLQGFKVHPDIAASLKHVFSYHDPSVVFRALQSLNFAVKRAAVSISGFHLNALAESGLFGGVNPVTAFRLGQKMLLEGKKITIGGKPLMYNGKVADAVDILVRNGLKIGTEDIGGASHEAFVRNMGKLVDTVVPVGKVGEKAASGIIKVTQVMDKLTWDMAHVGVKLAVGTKEFEKAILKNISEHTNDPRIPLKNLDELAQHVTSYVNDIAGGLDWRRAAESVQNKFFRKIALQATTPIGRQWMQLLMFAPDWTLSNIRAAVKAIPGVTSKDIAQLHRSYVLRGAIYYAIVGNALNMAFSGHPWWDNKDPTQIELGDGRHLLFSKHLIEPVRWLPFVGKPMQEALNKLAFLPKEVISQLTNKEYLSSNNTAPPMTRETDKWYKQTYERLGHIAKQFTPISGQQLSQQGPGGVWGFLGHPIYGRTEEQKAQAQMAKDMDFSTAVDNMFNQSMGK